MYTPILKIINLISLALLFSCIHTTAIADKKAIVIQTLNLYNQRSEGEGIKNELKSIKGDWFLRRSRLSIIDKALNSIRPDIVAMQEVLSKGNSLTDDDLEVLKFGSLRNYNIYKKLVKTFYDFDENEFLALAVLRSSDKYVYLNPNKNIKLYKQKSGLYMVAPIMVSGDEFILINAKIRPITNENSKLIELLAAEMQVLLGEVIETYNTCRNRIILTGQFPQVIKHSAFLNLLNNFDLVNTGLSECQFNQDCYTADPINEFFNKTYNNYSKWRANTIYVHNTAIVSNFKYNVNKPVKDYQYGKKHGLTKLWPTKYFGWQASVKLTKCN